MTRHREDQPSLFDKKTPSVAVKPAQKSELATGVEALLSEIAAALASKTSGATSHE